MSLLALHQLYCRRTGAWARQPSATSRAACCTPLNTIIGATLPYLKTCPQFCNCERWLRSFKSKGTWRERQRAKTYERYTTGWIGGYTGCNLILHRRGNFSRVRGIWKWYFSHLFWTKMGGFLFFNFFLNLKCSVAKALEFYCHTR